MSTRENRFREIIEAHIIDAARNNDVGEHEAADIATQATDQIIHHLKAMNYIT